MKRSLTALCLLLCLASVVAAQNANANATGTPDARVQNANAANANANANAGLGNNVNGNTNTAGGNSTNPVTLEVRPGQTAKIVVGPEDEEGGVFPAWLKDGVDLFSKLLTFITVAVAVFLAWFEVNKNRAERAQDKKDREERQQKDKDDRDERQRKDNEERDERLRKDKEERDERQRKDIEAKDKDREQSELNRQQREQDVAQRKVELRWRKAQLAREMLKGLYDDPYATDMMLMLDWNDREFSVRSSRGQPARLEKISWEEMWAALRVTELHFNDKEKFIRDCLDAFFGRMQTIEHYLGIELVELEDVAYPFDYYLDAIGKNPVMFDNFIAAYHPRAASFLRSLRKFISNKEAASQTPSSPTLPVEAAPSTEQAATEQAAADASAYFMFDCPPGDERFYVKLKDPSAIAEARAMLGGEYEWHLTGDIVSGKVYYNERWDFHVAPASVRFVESDPHFAHRMNEAVEAQTGRPKAVFAENNVWHTAGARLLAELPTWWFDRERDGRQSEEQNALRMHGRVVETADGGTATEDAGGASKK
jgi:hypothetical protein